MPQQGAEPRPERPASLVRSVRAVGWSMAACFLLGLVALFAYAPIFAVDFFWHLKLGALMVADRAIPTTDLFSAVHPERPYVQFQWLWDVLAYAAYRAQGLHGVRLLQVGLMVASYLLLAKTSWKLLREPARVFLVCALALVLFEDRFQARPSATMLGFVALALPWWLDTRPAVRGAELLAITLLAAAWSNLHGGESVLFVLGLSARAVGSLLELRAGQQTHEVLRASGLRLLAALLGTLLSPTFVPGMLSWASVIAPQVRSGNQEWLPSYTMLRYGVSPSHLLIALGPTLVSLGYVGTAWRRVRAGDASRPWSEWLLVGGLVVLAQQAVRNAFLCIVPLILLLRLRPTRRLEPYAVVLGAGCLGAAAHDHIVIGYGGVAEMAPLLAQDLAPNAFPEELATFMSEAGIEGPLLNDGRWGGYLAWKLWPRCHVFADSRHHFTPPMWPVFLASQSPRLRPTAMDEAFRRWGVELTAFSGPTFPAIRPHASWQLLYKAGDQELYEHRRGAHAQVNLQRTRAWLARTESHRSDLTEIGAAELSHAMTAAGAKRWLSAPYRVHRRAQLARLAQQPTKRVEALRGEASLLYDTGNYADALQLLAQVLTLNPGDTAALYRAALASHALHRPEDSQSYLERLRPSIATLSKHQRGRLSVLAEQLAQTPGATGRAR